MSSAYVVEQIFSFRFFICGRNCGVASQVINVSSWKRARSHLVLSIIGVVREDMVANHPVLPVEEGDNILSIYRPGNWRHKRLIKARMRQRATRIWIELQMFSLEAFQSILGFKLEDFSSCFGFWWKAAGYFAPKFFASDPKMGLLQSKAKLNPSLYHGEISFRVWDLPNGQDVGSITMF